VGAASTGVVELDVVSMVEVASVGVDEAISSTGGVEVGADSVDVATVSTVDVDAVLELVDVAATCARTGLTMANPTTSAMTIALAPAMR
jgi:hypothetical protein